MQAHSALSLDANSLTAICTVVQRVMLPMLHTGQYLPLRRAIAWELIRNDDPRGIAQSLEQFAEECLRGSLVTAPLHEDIEHMSVLIHRPPQKMTLAMHRQKDFIQMPCVARSRAAVA